MSRLIFRLSHFLILTMNGRIHISRAMWALQHGNDFYFSDFYQLHQTVSAFARAGRIDVTQHPRIHPVEPIHEYQGDMFDQILRETF